MLIGRWPFLKQRQTKKERHKYAIIDMEFLLIFNKNALNLFEK